MALREMIAVYFETITKKYMYSVCKMQFLCASAVCACSYYWVLNDCILPMRVLSFTQSQLIDVWKRGQ